MNVDDADQDDPGQCIVWLVGRGRGSETLTYCDLLCLIETPAQTPVNFSFDLLGSYNFIIL
jgi:hypothetical protein